MRSSLPRLIVAFTLAALIWGMLMAIAVAGCTGRPGTVYPCEYPIALASACLNASTCPEGFACGGGDCIRVTSTGAFDACCTLEACPGHCTADPCPDGSSPDGGFDVTTTEGGDATSAETGPSPACSGVCVSLPPDGWSDPQLFWSGPTGTAPQCPADAPVVAYQGHADPITPPPASCTPCTCSPSSGTCGPPQHFAASSSACSTGAPASMPFDPPASWDGTCTDDDAIAAGATCGGMPCVSSLTSGPVALSDDGCMASGTVLVNAAPPSWSTDAVACRGNTYPLGGCFEPGVTCAIPPPSGFSVCVYQSGDNACPASYPDKYVAFGGFDDTRGCTSCACAAPSGSLCTATLSVFKDTACATPLPLAVPIGSGGPSCFDLMPAGLPLGSKTVTGLAYQPGTCIPSGGQATGSVDPSGPSTFCCLPASTGFP
jgi:hypothetical protein